MTKEKLDDYMASHGISELSFTERFGKWENCF